MSISYRADIDGLRALAVSLVIFNHLGFSAFSGGYIGVDVFFVISGYLITAILIKDIQQQKFSFGRFYKKRIVRLAPAFFTMLAAVSALSCVLMLPHELLQYAKSALYSTFFMANIFMREEVGDYFSVSTDQIPLLHLWSLGVEEQFYIFWPVCLLLLIKRVNMKWMLWIAGGAIIALLAYAQYAVLQNAEKAYYQMSVRAFELLIGAVLCFVPSVQFRKWQQSILVWLGFCGILLCAVLFSSHTVFPGAMALVPCLSAALIIYAGQQAPNANPVLAHPLSAWIGKISYPMYLWHWPLIAFANIYLLPKDLAHQVVIIAVTVLLAYATYRWIELPSRNFLKLSSRKVILGGFMLPAALISGCVKDVQAEQGWPERFPAAVNRHAHDLTVFAHALRSACHNAPAPNQLPQPRDCVLGVEKTKTDFLLIGDSHANHFTGMLDVWAKDANLRGYDATQDTTIFLPDTDLYFLENGRYGLAEKFRIRNEAIAQHLQTHHYAKIVLAGYYEEYLRMYLLKNNRGESGEQAMLQGFRKAMKMLQASADEVVMILDTPELTGEMQADCPVRSEALARGNPCEFKRLNDSASQQFNAVLQTLRAEYPKLKIIDPKLLTCKALVCTAAIHGVPLYRDQDDDHLNYPGSEALGRAYMQQYGNPLK